MNLHTPERQADETQQQYRWRQQRSKVAAARMSKGPKQAPASSPLDVSRFFLGQHTNEKRNAQRLAKRMALAARRHQWQPQTRTRKHVQHKHPLRDAHGAYTLTGARPLGDELRAMWLAGISAQRGY